MPDRRSVNDALIIEPKRRFRSVNLSELWAQRDLIYIFLWRDLKIRYKQTVLGAAWAVIQPLSLTLVFTIFFGHFARVPTGDLPRPVFYFAALVPWTFFSHSVLNATNSVIGNRSIITKVYFPRLIFPISAVVANLVDLAIGIAILFGLTVAFGISPGLEALALPLFVITTVVVALAAGVWFAALNARYRDVQYGVAFIVQVWMFSSPVVYPSTIVPEAWRTVYFLNPMAGVIEGFRWSLTGIGSGPGMPTLVSTIAACVMLFAGLAYFRRNETLIVDVV